MGAEVTRGQQEQEATMTLRAGGQWEVQLPETRCQGCGVESVALKKCLKAGQERERYPGFSLFLFC